MTQGSDTIVITKEHYADLVADQVKLRELGAVVEREDDQAEGTDE